MDSEEVWFSHREKIYQIKKSRIEWTEEKKIWNWDRCTVSFVKPPISPESASPKKLRVVVRSNTNQNQTSVRVNRPMTLRFMLGFDIEILPSDLLVYVPCHRNSIGGANVPGNLERIPINL